MSGGQALGLGLLMNGLLSVFTVSFFSDALCGFCVSFFKIVSFENHVFVC